MSRISELREAIATTDEVAQEIRYIGIEIVVDAARDHLALLESLEDGSAYERAADALDQQLPLGRLVTVAQIVVDAAFKVEP